jgi:diguanylate cyclase (GGDEF)-like protein
MDVLAWAPSELVGTDLLSLVHPDDQERLAAVRAARRPGVTSRVRYRLRGGTGTYRWFETCANAARDAATGELITVASLRDVDDEVRARIDADELRDRQHAILDSLLDPWILLAAVRDGDGAIVDFEYLDANRAACRANGLTLSDLLGRRLLELFPEHGPSGWFDAYARVVETGEPLSADEVPFVVAADGGVPHWFDNRAVRIGDGLSFTWRDVTERYLARHTAQVLARHDALTGLPNRLSLLERLPARLARANPGSSVAVLFCDVDGFKAINDEHGHEAGDEVLREVARRMTSSVRSNDYVARLGGDEFVILLDRVRDLDEAATVADKVRVAVAHPMPLGRGPGEVTLSIGVVVAAGQEQANLVLAAADEALYRAKDSGRNCVRVRTTTAPGPDAPDRS